MYHIKLINKNNSFVVSQNLMSEYFTDWFKEHVGDLGLAGLRRRRG
jgi:hypothetical protein|tara:strand:- start:916 stop:1053 length:138 start_codon:yes stop_codon:yes gene_type:complete